MQSENNQEKEPREIRCPKCNNRLDFQDSQNSHSQMAGQTEHYCVACSETFWVDASGKMTSWDELASRPGITIVDDFSDLK